MKKLLALLFILVGGVTFLSAHDTFNQYLSKEDFRAKQRAYFIEKAGLTNEEAEKFFPIYFELQDKKQNLNEESIKWIRKGRNDNLTDAQYEEMILKVYDLRIQADKLDRAYYQRLKQIISPKKLYKIMHVEFRFRRDMLKELQRKGERNRAKAPAPAQR
jgi:hypothetical protein